MVFFARLAEHGAQLSAHVKMLTTITAEPQIQAKLDELNEIPIVINLVYSHAGGCAGSHHTNER